MTGGFPIFQLPLVALKEVISQIDLVDIIRLSLVSKTSYCITKTLHQKSIKFRIEMVLCCSIAVEIKHNGSLFGRSVFEAFEITKMSEDHDFIRIQNYSIPVAKTAEKSLHTYWTDPVEGLKIMTDYVTEFFGFKKIECLSVTGQQDSEKFRSIIDYLGEKSIKSIPYCYYEASGENRDDIYTYFLNKLKVTEKFFLYIRPSENFRYNLSLDLDYFETCGSHWITVDELVKMNSRFMSIIGTKIDSQGYNRFLKHWQNGGSDRIGHFTLGSENVFEFEQLFEGIDVNVRDDNLRRLFEYPHGEDVIICGGCDIRRNDGKLATLYPVGGEDKALRMVTWPDWNNNSYEI